jgi:hypothetical protein
MTTLPVEDDVVLEDEVVAQPAVQPLADLLDLQRLCLVALRLRRDTQNTTAVPVFVLMQHDDPQRPIGHRPDADLEAAVRISVLWLIAGEEEGDGLHIVVGAAREGQDDLDRGLSLWCRDVLRGGDQPSPTRLLQGDLLQHRALCV